MTLKTENQLYADVISFINDALYDLGISGWKVLQLKQPVKLTEINPTVYVTITNKKRTGWQGRNYPVIDKQLKIKEKFNVEFDVQISALRRRNITDTVNTINSYEILENLKAYFLNINNITLLRQKGYSFLQPSSVQNPDFVDDSDNFEFMPFFSMTFIIEQTLMRAQTAIDDYNLTIKGV